MTMKFDQRELVTDLGMSKLDAGGGILAPGGALFFRRQLEYIYPELYKKKLPTLNLFKLFSVDTSPPEGAESHTFRIYEGQGGAEFIADYANDGPPVDASGKEQNFPIRDIANSYSFSFREIAAAMMADNRLSMLQPEYARRLMEERHNRVGFYGAPEKGLQGILDYEGGPRALFPVTIDDQNTGDDIIAAINNLIYGIKRRTNGTEGQGKRLVLCLPIAEYNYIVSTPRSATTDTTIAEFLLATNSSLARIEECHELGNDDQDPIKTEAFTRLGHSRFAFVYDPDPRVVSYVMPTPFTQLPSEPKGYTMLTNCYSSTGGIKMVYPLATVKARLPIPNNIG